MSSTGVEIVYGDDALLVLAKPAGLLSVPGRGPDKQDALSVRVQQIFPDALIVHRLDMATSGLMLMARGIAVQRQLGTAFAERRIDKRYEAVVDGHWQATAGLDGWGEIDLPLRLDWPRRPLSIVDPIDGKPSVTRWKLLAHDAVAGGSRLALAPLTGRSHQLRVHLTFQGHPILGDALYAPAEVQARAERLLLHACALELDHPTTGERIRFTHPVPF